MPRYRVTTELVYFTDQPDTGTAYLTAETLTIVSPVIDPNVQLTVSTVLELPDGDHT
jgi:hypothetical protein